MNVICPICRKETAWKENPFRPFCSERCRTVDLGRWAAEEYRVSGERTNVREDVENKKNRSDE